LRSGEKRGGGEVIGVFVLVVDLFEALSGDESAIDGGLDSRIGGDVTGTRGRTRKG
jgi:hypothetical protein